MRYAPTCAVVLVLVGSVSLAAQWPQFQDTSVPRDAQGRVRSDAPPPRTADGKPDLNGIWQALNTANWDIETHSAAPGLISALGASNAVPGGLGVVDGEIPYRPEALAKKKENYANRMKLDPEIMCYLPGVPRATYMPYPFQIFQTPQAILIAYEFANATRAIQMGGKEESPSDTWMGWSSGRWEGNTLVVDVTNFSPKFSFQAAREHLHLVERFTRLDAKTIEYAVTI